MNINCETFSAVSRLILKLDFLLRIELSICHQQIKAGDVLVIRYEGPRGR